MFIGVSSGLSLGCELYKNQHLKELKTKNKHLYTNYLNLNTKNTTQGFISQ
jgi:hypothetical protein